MFDLSILFIIPNILFIVILFWIITFLGSFSFNKIDNNVRHSFYECGFKSISDFNFKLNIGTLSIITYILFYDLELLFLLPFLLSQVTTTYVVYINIIYIYICILITFLIDIYEDIIGWDF